MTQYDDCGVIFIATGSSFLDEVVSAAQRVRDCCPDISQTLFTSLDKTPGVFDEVRGIPNPSFGFADKVENLSRTPYERTVYLDGDIYLAEPSGLYDIFDMLQDFDVTGSHAMMRTVDIDDPLSFYQDKIPDSFPIVNGGLLGYRRNEDVESMLDDWARKYRRDLEIDDTVGDQSSLRAAIYESDVRFATLPPEYNFRIPYEQMVIDDVKLFHGRVSNIDELVNCVNSAETLMKARLYVPIYTGRSGPGGEYMHVTPVMNPRKGEVTIRRVYKSLTENGVSLTALYLLLGGINVGYTRVEKVKEMISSKGKKSTLFEIIRWSADRFT